MTCMAADRSDNHVIKAHEQPHMPYELGNE